MTPKNKYKNLTFYDKEIIVNYKPIISGEEFLTLFSEQSPRLKWLTKAKFENAEISIAANTVFWHNGIWEDGVWEDGIWHDGYWEQGVWIKGIWKNGEWKRGLWRDGIWEKGNHYKGTWENGRWKGGAWHNGIWVEGLWENGVWLDGTWENGEWFNGLWKDGKWMNGVWDNGTWEGGMFHNGIFKNGIWKSDKQKPRNKRHKFEKPLQQGDNTDKTYKTIGRIKNPVRYGVAYELSKFGYQPTDKIDIKQLKKLTKDSFKLNQLLTKKDGNILLQKFPNGFSITDIVGYEQQNLSSPNKYHNYSPLLSNKNIEIGYADWDGAQRYMKELPNLVFQVNFKKPVSDYLTKIFPIFKEYLSDSNHPTSKRLLTLGWVRYTKIEQKDYSLDKGIVLDEIQTDLISLLKSVEDKQEYHYTDDGELNWDIEEFFKAIKDWDEFVMSLFIKFVRNTLHYKKIYMPTYQSKLDLYHAEPPMHLYKELPNKFGFKKEDKQDRFLVLEKKELNLISLISKINE